MKNAGKLDPSARKRQSGERRQIQKPRSGGIIPAMLGVTGIAMWWKARRRRTAMIERRALRTA